ncbi:hypothetical protein FDUTEX481_07633 [Tolypothrix sp. PCC 7601]|nr:hypothetical protein FDUTEX481_07633 [Tolypothrix sp. PCC 7601]
MPIIKSQSKLQTIGRFAESLMVYRCVALRDNTPYITNYCLLNVALDNA